MSVISPILHHEKLIPNVWDWLVTKPKCLKTNPRQTIANIAISLINQRVMHPGDPGSLRMSLSSEGKETAEQVNDAAIKDASVLFTPGTRIKTIIAAAKFQKA